MFIDRIPVGFRSNVGFFSCDRCNATYYCQTGHHLKLRVSLIVQSCKRTQVLCDYV